MTLLRIGLALTLALGVCGCAVGGPDRASDIQNLNAINDDISAVTMTQSATERTRDPNARSTLPNNYETSDTR
ncbi:MAG TPA: hypothetical protein VND95_13975 [Stellaceae bacterium]|nr:hypothetical protein [Stellaceae bacterium]